jgi:hypothetical protein
VIEESFEGDEFEVRYGPRFEGESQDWWLVSLPHQCGSWVISAKLHKEDAVKDLELFISKARTALEELKRMSVAELRDYPKETCDKCESVGLAEYPCRGLATHCEEEQHCIAIMHMCANQYTVNQHGNECCHCGGAIRG